MTSSPDPQPPASRRDDPRMQTAEMAALGFEGADEWETESETIGSGPVDVPWAWWKIALMVAAGGALGSMLRFVITILAPTVTTPTLVEVPWATFWVNAIGCLALGALTGVLEVRRAGPWVQPLLGTGLCGGFTTMSTVVLEGSAMIGADFPLKAFGYALLTVVVCLGAVVIGMLAGRRIAQRMAESSRGQRDSRGQRGTRDQEGSRVRRGSRRQRGQRRSRAQRDEAGADGTASTDEGSAT
ncbi:fluoride efflux transporter FluC [Brachybacterium sp. GCM10030252]|uniref:fluoride efflux transporter FluC n=1 Tax=Brachybacterium sp. GCM10030252 TaxID=3273380 RepID=UPI003608B58F